MGLGNCVCSYYSLRDPSNTLGESPYGLFITPIHAVHSGNKHLDCITAPGVLHKVSSTDPYLTVVGGGDPDSKYIKRLVLSGSEEENN